MGRQGERDGQVGEEEWVRQGGKKGQARREEWAGNFRPAPTWSIPMRLRHGPDRRNGGID